MLQDQNSRTFDFVSINVVSRSAGSESESQCPYPGMRDVMVQESLQALRLISRLSDA